MVAGGRDGRRGADIRAVARTDLPRHQARPDRQSAALPGPRHQPVEQRVAVRPGAEPGLRLPVSARHFLPGRPPAGNAGVDHPAAVVGAAAHGRLLGAAAGRRGAGHRQPGVAGDRRGGVRAVAAGADHPRVDLVGNPADDAGAVGAAAYDSGAAWEFGSVGASPGRSGRCGSRVDGRRQRHRDTGRMSAGGDLVGVPSAEPTVVAIHRMVVAGPRPGDVVVGGGADSAAQGQSPVPRLHRILRRDDAMVVVDRDVARHRQLDPVRGTGRDRGRAAGLRIGCRPGHFSGRGGGPGRTRRAGPCRPAAGW